MDKIILTKGSKAIEVEYNGDDIKIELLRGFPPGMTSERVVDTVMREFSIKDKVGHKPHIHTPEGQVIFTG